MERIDKILSNLGYGTRKDLKKIVKNGMVQVNGITIKDSAMKVDPEKDKIVINGEEIFYREFIYLMMNKPAGVISATFDNKDETVIDLLEVEHQVFEPFPVGRLDKPSQGLIILTNDGVLANKILESENEHEKEYIVTLDKDFDEKFIEGMSSGVEICGQITRPCKVFRVDNNTFRIILTQGLNKQIRRMSKVFGYNVIRLERVRIMNITLDGIEYGKYRFISESEVDEMLRLTEKNNL